MALGCFAAERFLTRSPVNRPGFLSFAVMSLDAEPARSSSTRTQGLPTRFNESAHSFHFGQQRSLGMARQAAYSHGPHAVFGALATDHRDAMNIIA